MNNLEWIKIPGLIAYDEMLSLMEDRVSQVISGKKPETVFLVEHQDVYTAGTSALDTELLEDSEIPVFNTGRGGKYTYHGPGQRVIYPILNLAAPHRQKDLRLYIHNLEQLIINSLARLGVRAFRAPSRIGIWTLSPQTGLEEKIGAIGVRVKKWVTFHGAAVNINTNLENFTKIIPCGISNYGVTSLNNLKSEMPLEEFDKILEDEFKKIFCHHH